MSEWISVEDRLPLELSEDDHYQEVMVLVTDGVVVETCSFCRGNVGELWREWGIFHTSFPTKGITHWMQLPALPEE